MKYENYKELAKKYLSNKLTYNSRGEFIGGSDTNNLIPEEVKKILNLQPNDVLLDIGCGIKPISIELSKFVKTIILNDSEEVLKVVKKNNNNSNNLFYEPGNFLNFDIKRFKKYNVNKILVYSVLHYTKKYSDQLNFIKKAIFTIKESNTDLTKNILIGDLPDKNSKNFLNSYYLYLLKNKIIIARDLIRSNKKYAKIYNLDESQVIFDKKDKINNLFFLPVDIDTTRIFYNLINLNENIKLSLLSQRPNLPFINRKDILIYFY